MKIEINQKNWNQWLEVKGLSNKTRTEYNSYLEKINKENFNQETIITFLQRYNNSLARATLKNLIQYLKMMKYKIDIDIPKVTGRKRQRIIEIVKEEDIIELSNKMKTERSKLMLLISFYGGLRISELVGEEYAIKPYAFNWHTWTKEPDNNGTLKITGKGNKQRTVFIPQHIMSRTYQYIRNEISQKQSKDDPLFKIGERRWKKILAEESTKHLDRHINPHLLRHSCNQWLRSKGWDVTERQKYLGHSNPTTTMIYDHTNPEDLKNKFNQIF